MIKFKSLVLGLLTGAFFIAGAQAQTGQLGPGQVWGNFGATQAPGKPTDLTNTAAIVSFKGSSYSYPNAGIGIGTGAVNIIPLDIVGMMHARRGVISNGPVTASQPLTFDMLPGVAATPLGSWTVGGAGAALYAPPTDTGMQAIYQQSYFASNYSVGPTAIISSLTQDTHLSSGNNGSVTGTSIRTYLDGTWTNTTAVDGGQVTMFVTATNSVGGGDNFNANFIVQVLGTATPTRSVTPVEIDIDNRVATGTKLGLAVNDDGTSIGAAMGAYALTGYSDVSSTSISYGTGSKVFTVSGSSDTWYAGGQLVLAECTTGGLSFVNYMVGTVTSYSGTTLTLNISFVPTTPSPSGSCSAWKISAAIPANIAVMTQSIAGSAGFATAFAALGQGGGAPVASGGTILFAGGGTAKYGIDFRSLTIAAGGCAIATPGANFSTYGMCVDQIGDISVQAATQSSSTGSGSIQTAGGIGAVKNLFVGGNGNIAGTFTLAGVLQNFPATGNIVGTTDTQVLTNKTINASSNTLSNIANAALTNSAITLGATAISLGASSNNIVVGAGDFTFSRSDTTDTNLIIKSTGVASHNAGFITVLGSDTSSFPGIQIGQASTVYWTLQQRADTNLHLWRSTGTGNVLLDGGGNLQVSTGAAGVALSLANTAGTCTHTPTAASETVSCSSDARLKQNIADAMPALPDLLGMKVHAFDIIANGKHEPYGTIAQEMLLTHPSMVHMNGERYTVDVPSPWKIVKAIQELDAKINALEMRK